MIILDTNILSELMRPSPNMRVVNWLNAEEPLGVTITAITVAEILYGIERLPDGKRKQRFAQLAAEMFEEDFTERILPFDEVAAAYYATLVADSERSGRIVHSADAQTAAICQQHKAQLATRNVKDFEHLGISIIDPWRVE
ncbi:type II toxin-antitoxin system VapC family toxin [Vreelandella neptunia]|uniref:type II toxin-antitoxin system VapC family toxin n=1 Tax=Vreelandella neptunia TaxID=115551 RepID=UPI003159EA41